MVLGCEADSHVGVWGWGVCGTETGGWSQSENVLGGQGSRAGDEDSALKGVSFAAMSAAGPSGARHEHLRRLLRIKRKCVVNRLLRVLETFLERALGGDLPGGAHWMLHSQLAFICKPGSDTPINFKL